MEESINSFLRLIIVLIIMLLILLWLVGVQLEFKYPIIHLPTLVP